jgi:hypothetical protein
VRDDREVEQEERMIKTYQDFDLHIRGSVKTGFTVEAVVSGGGSVLPQALRLPRDRSFGQRLDHVLGQSADRESIEIVGRGLREALFPLPIDKLWANTIGALTDQFGLRLRLRIGPPVLMALPWELIFEEEYVGLRVRFPIVRYLDLLDPPRPLAVRPPLRVLVAVSEPGDVESLDVDAELTSIRTALKQLQDKVEVDVLNPARRDDLLAILRQGYHVLHFIGHGVFTGGEGYLVLEDSEGYSDRTSALLLGHVVADSNLRLIVLNACDTSVTGLRSALGGVAHQLVRMGMPAVIAMQQAVAERSALAFSREFYGALADGWPVDAAVQEGRRSIVAALGNNWNRCVDWAIPTLYMRAPDGVILGIHEENDAEMVKQTDESASWATYATTFHGAVHGPVHTGEGDIHVSSLQYGMDVDDLDSLFEALHKHVREQAPPDQMDAALEKVDALQEAVKEDKPNLSRMQSVLDWFKRNIPQLVGAVTSVILNPLVGKVVEAAGDLVVEEFKRRFGK